MTRLVSAYYADYHPFDSLPGVGELYDTCDPDDLKAGDILLVWGGGDIPPEFYNKGRSRKSHASAVPNQRDLVEWALMQQAAKLGIPIIGICRGAQMLCALNGGYLIQHVNGHAGWGHPIRTQEGSIINVNSIHHQMMQPQGTKHELVAWAETSLSDVYYDVDTLVEVDIEPEYVRFPDIRGFAMQWHPEMMELARPANQYLLQDISEQLKL